MRACERENRLSQGLPVPSCVLEANDGDATAREDRRAPRIPFGPLRVVVDGAVDLDDEPERGAVEVHLVAADHLLPAELQAEHLAVAQEPPGEHLGASPTAA